jgi:hypothetical protein
METAMSTMLVRMKLTKLHKVLASYEEVDDTDTPVKKPRVSAVYLRQSNFEKMPETIMVTIQLAETTK